MQGGRKHLKSGGGGKIGANDHPINSPKSERFESVSHRAPNVYG